MSREIKFRAWNLDYEWMAFDFYIGSNGVTFDEPSRHYNTPNIEIEENPNLIIMQFTGLKDKNGVDIYEGDIVVVNESHKFLEADFGKNKRVVQWREGGARLDMLHVDYLDSKGKAGLTFDNGMVDSIEVIGNIYENPELLTPKPTTHT